MCKWSLATVPANPAFANGPACARRALLLHGPGARIYIDCVHVLLFCIILIYYRRDAEDYRRLQKGVTTSVHCKDTDEVPGEQNGVTIAV